MAITWMDYEQSQQQRSRLRGRMTFVRARQRLVDNLRAELGTFNNPPFNDTRHIKKLSPREYVFLLFYGSVTARQAKITCDAGQPLAAAAEEMFERVLKGAVDEYLRPVYEAKSEALAAIRARRSAAKS